MLFIVSVIGWVLFIPLSVFFGLIVIDELIVLGGYFLVKRRLPSEGAADADIILGRYAFLLVCHNEEIVLPDLLGSIANLDYPQDKHSVFVLADDCSDRTAELARSHGATVFQRHEGGGLGKGFAVQHLINCIEDQRENFDATITLDSDAKLDRAYLQEMNRIHQAGYQVVMGRPETPKEKASLSWINSFGLRCVAISETARFAMGFAARFSSNTTLIHRDIWKSFDWKCLEHLNTAEEMCGWFIERGTSDRLCRRSDCDRRGSTRAGKFRWAEVTLVHHVLSTALVLRSAIVLVGDSEFRLVAIRSVGWEFFRHRAYRRAALWFAADRCKSVDG